MAACNGEEIVVVALAYEIPNYNINTVYMDTFAVSELSVFCGQLIP